MERTMKKQTFEILPVSPEERKHLIGLSYNEIGDFLQEKDSLSLISYLNSNSVKIAEMAILTYMMIALYAHFVIITIFNSFPF